MSSKVYFVNLRARSPRENKISKIRKLYEAAGFDEFVNKNDLVCTVNVTRWVFCQLTIFCIAKI